MNPNETELNISAEILPGDAIWLNSTTNITERGSNAVPRPTGGPPILLRFKIGVENGDREINVTVAADAGEKAKSVYFGVLQADTPQADHAPDSSDRELFREISATVIGLMVAGLAVLIVGACVRYGWWKAWRARKAATREDMDSQTVHGALLP
jgi:hypothetical protein